MNATFLGLAALGSEGAAGVVIDAAIKGAVVLALAAVIAWCLRRASASKRHLVWALALGALALLPVLSLALPRWRVAVFPAPAMQPQTSVFVSPGEAVSDAPADALEVPPPAFA